MANNLLANFFGHDVTNLAAHKIHEHDWVADGVDCIYIIFITGRCGSTWLTHLLEDSGICGHPHELFNETMMPRFNRTIKANTFSEYFSGAVSSFSSGGRFGFKIDEFRFRNLLPLIDFSSLFPKSMTKFFWMTRMDLIDQAFSFARAKETGHWHDFAGSPSQSCADADISELQMWKEILDLIAKEDRMCAFFMAQGIEPYKLTYEEITADRLFSVMKVMLELQCEPEQVQAFIQRMEDKTLKLQLGNKYSILGNFYARYRPLLRNLAADRARLNVEDIKGKLRCDYNLTI